MTLDQFVADHGLAAVFVGCFFEGDSTAITAGVFAHRHLLVLWQVVVVAAASVFLCDMTLYLVGRRLRRSGRLQSFMSRPGPARVLRTVHRNPYRVASIYRFVPGLRIAGPLALGQSGLATGRFAMIAMAAALVWASLCAVLGHAIGMAIHAVFGHIDREEFLLAVPLVALLVVTSIAARRKRAARAGPASAPGLRPREQKP